MSRRRAGAVATLAVVTWLVSALVPACLSPTLPVPPPALAELQEPLARLSADGTTIVIVGTGAAPGALVHLWNEETLDGTIAKADPNGRYQKELGVALSCSVPRNHVALWQTDMDGTNSRINTYRLPNMFGDSLPPENAPDCRDSGQIDAGTADVAAAALNTDTDNLDERGTGGTEGGDVDGGTR